MLEKDNLFKGSIACVCIFCCAGPILIIVGAVFLASGDTRGPKIRTFNNAVMEWNRGARESFLNKDFVVRNQFENAEYALKANTAEDPLNDSPKDGETFESYTPLKYQVTDLQFFVDNAQFQEGKEHTREVIDNTTSGNTYQVLTFRDTVFDTYQYTPSSGSSSVDDDDDDDDFGNSDERQECNRYEGYYSGTRCTLYYATTELCTTVNLGSDDSWEASPRGGCYFRDFSKGADTVALNDNTPSRYRKVPTNSNPPTQVSGANTGIFTLRNAKDPWVVAQEVTDGTLDFGLSVGEKRTIGGVLLGLGLAALLPLCFCIGAALFLAYMMGYILSK
eukprot:gb/GECH01007329.1/.p1 GENE.gb/GECH01007329.1/~~gb/GECH01007329.1/.p1  ORF type:complete len:334 (+),score=56.63 gb/GECH01007329.1/:1-1002(+)